MEKTDETKHVARLLKATDVAEYLNISESMAYRLMQTRAIPTVKIGAASRVRPVDLQDYIQDNLIPANSRNESKVPFSTS